MLFLSLFFADATEENPTTETVFPKGWALEKDLRPKGLLAAMIAGVTPCTFDFTEASWQRIDPEGQAVNMTIGGKSREIRCKEYRVETGLNALSEENLCHKVFIMLAVSDPSEGLWAHYFEPEAGIKLVRTDGGVLHGVVLTSFATEEERKKEEKNHLMAGIELFRSGGSAYQVRKIAHSEIDGTEGVTEQLEKASLKVSGV